MGRVCANTTEGVAKSFIFMLPRSAQVVLAREDRLPSGCHVEQPCNGCQAIPQVYSVSVSDVAFHVI